MSKVKKVFSISHIMSIKKGSFNLSDGGKRQALFIFEARKK
jgi:hypothetical protein